MALPHKSYIIAGTDTDIGKTVFAAALTQALNAAYWKPIQSGVETVDTKIVQTLTDLPDEHFIPEAHVLSEPLSPHRAAEIDGVTINPTTIKPPPSDRDLIIELAGGLMVPITRDVLQIDMIAAWNIPVIVCARTGLGTINHTLLSLKALKAKNIHIHGLVFIGDDNPDNIKTIGDIAGVPILGRLPIVENLNTANLKAAFKSNFQIKNFA